MGVIADIERVAHSIDKDIPVYNVETMPSTRPSRWGNSAQPQSWIGVAQSVAQRTREVGIRMALGAAPGSVSRLVVREG